MNYGLRCFLYKFASITWIRVYFLINVMAMEFLLWGLTSLKVCLVRRHTWYHPGLRVKQVLFIKVDIILLTMLRFLLKDLIQKRSLGMEFDINWVGLLPRGFGPKSFLSQMLILDLIDSKDLKVQIHLKEKSCCLTLL